MLLEKNISKNKDDVAVISKEKKEYKEYTYQTIYKQIRKTAAFFKDIGIGKDTHCGLLLENRVEWLISYFALIYNGAVCVPLNPLQRSEETINLCNDCKAIYIISSQDIYQKKLKEDQNKLPKLILLDRKEEQEKIIPFSKNKDYQQRPKSEEIDSDQAASLIYTSGTTGSPRGVLLTHRNIISNLRSIQKLKLIKRKDNLLSVLPLFHAYPFMVNLIAPFLSGIKITYFKVSLRQEVIFSTLKEAGVTILVLIPQFYEKMHEKIFEKVNSIPKPIRFMVFPFIKIKIRKKFGKKLRLMVSGGARLDKQIGTDFRKLGFAFTEGYGLTETSPILTFNPPDRVKPGSVGRALPGIGIKIDNPDKSGAGEVCAKGANVMKGYFRRPDLTRKVMKNGWFYTGDLGFIDKEGYLFLTGRKKEVIVLSSGKNIYPQDVEEEYLKSPYIKEICIISKEKPKGGQESLFGVVVPDTEYFKQKNESDIKGKIRWQIEQISINLPAYQRIHNFVITKEELSRTALGKIKRYKVKEKYFEQKEEKAEKKKRKIEDDPDIKDKAKAQTIVKFLSQKLDKEVYLDDHLELDLGIDSLDRVELAAEAESKFSLKLPEDFFLQAATVKDLILKIITYRKKEKGQEFTANDWQNILKKEPSFKIKNKLKIKVSFFDILTSYFAKTILFCFFKLFFKLKVEGKGNIPDKKPFVICANHASYFDGFFIFSALILKYSREIFFIGYRDIFELSFFRWAIRLARLIPIDATTQLIESMRAAAYVLSKKKILCLFPEGERSPDGKLKSFKKGIGILLKELKVDVLPVYIQGSYQSWPRRKLLPRPHPVTIYFGKPLNGKQLLDKYQPKGKDKYSNVSEALYLEIKNIKEYFNEVERS